MSIAFKGGCLCNFVNSGKSLLGMLKIPHPKKAALLRKSYRVAGNKHGVFLIESLMESKLLKIKLNKGSEAYVRELIEYMQSNISLPKNEMEQKGYFWDSVFFAIEGNEEFMYLVLKSNDFSNIVINDNEIVATEFRNVYDEFRNKCWSQSGYTEPTFIACFNTVFEFGVAKT